MRLPAPLVEERIKFLRQLFTKDPTLSVRKAQVRLQAEFTTEMAVRENGQTRFTPMKGTMRNAAILAVRREVLTGSKKTGTSKA